MKIFFKCKLVLVCLGISVTTTALASELPYDLNLLRSAYEATIASGDPFETPGFDHISYGSERTVEAMIQEEMTGLPPEELENLSFHFQAAPANPVGEILTALFPRGTALPVFCASFVATEPRVETNPEATEPGNTASQSRSECRDIIRSPIFGAVSFLKTSVYIWRTENQLTGSMSASVFIRSAIDTGHYLRYRFVIR